MSDPNIDRTALGEYDAESWDRNDPHSHPAAGERELYGEHTLDEYQAQWARDEQARKEQERWALQYHG